MYWWSSIRDVKVALHKLTHEPPSRQHLFHSTNPSELSNSIMLHDIGIEKSGRMLRVAIDYRNEDFTITPTKDVLLDDSSKAMVESVRRGFQRNKAPTATDEFEGSGGVYFLRNAFGSYEAVFKPHDEEQGMPNNPKDRVGTGVEGLREYFQPGQGCLRELAAYIMDYKHFSGVPSTTLVHCEHPAFHYPMHSVSHVTGKSRQDKPFPKLGSLQKFIRGADLFEDLGPSLLSDFEVQKIALLDIRLLNCDRNAANILVLHKHEHNSDPESETDFESHEFVISGSPNARGGDMLHENTYHLVPIDHGYSMPPRLKIFEWDWTWLNYAHVKRPVHPDIINYMNALDISALLKVLTAQVALTDDSIFLLRLSHFLIVESFKAGLTLYEIAAIIARNGVDENAPSRLELAIEEAEENAYRTIELKSGRSKSISPYFYDTPGRSSADMTPCNRARHSSDPFYHGDSQLEGFFEDDMDINSCSHALHHSPMRPMMSKTNSCTQLESASADLSSSLGASHLPPPPCCGGLDTIVEAKRERGLSSMSNQSYESNVSNGSGGCLGSEDHKDSGFMCSTDIDSLGTSTSFGSSSTTGMGCRGIDENKWESHTNEDTPVGDGISAVKKCASLLDVGKTDAMSSVVLEGQPLRFLTSVDNHVLTPHRIKSPLTSSSMESSSLFPTSAKKAKFQMNDKGKVGENFRVTVPSPSEFGLKIWSVCGEKPDASSRESSADLMASRSSSDVTTAPAWSSVAPSADGEDCDYSYFVMEGTEVENVACMEYTHHELSGGKMTDPLMKTLFDVQVPEAIPLTRVVSFSGFESTLMYTNQSMRNMGNLRLERRRTIANSKEFKALRYDFAEKQVRTIVSRAASHKKTGHL